MNYAREFCQSVMLSIAALHKDDAHIEQSFLTQKYVEWFQQTFPKCWARWKDALIQQQLMHDDYVPLPLHPWQKDNMIVSAF